MVQESGYADSDLENFLGRLPGKPLETVFMSHWYATTTADRFLIYKIVKRTMVEK
jgi:hypothetical protein